MKVKIIGAGSIGNHLSHAARSLDWDVTIVDIDPLALKRTKESIYPSRYGTWDPKINLKLSNDQAIGNFDLICIGTPPNCHIQLANEALDEKPKALLIEKPLTSPDLLGCQELFEKAKSLSIPVFVGYDHAVSKSIIKLKNEIKKINSNEFTTLDVEFREHWGGIFAAHPWLSGPKESYLGFTKKGGGASGEHSHALHLWQSIALFTNKGRVSTVQASMNFINEDGLEYDSITAFNLVTETGFFGRCIQDVITNPPRKFLRLQGINSGYEWECNPIPDRDIIKIQKNDGNSKLEEIVKKRPEDFITELKHIEDAIKSKKESPISLEKGLETMMVLAAANLSKSESRTVSIDYSKGWKKEAFNLL
ncbi:MAG: hypothetical protein CBB97_14930 [Candidatus Endolissoclinum sp. TMED37]|nr:MAG: hypothetical protein CBB97_14930 [Candidatus Endolissoclinum sp. TMED37]|tara:strand:- start:580 stop:1671 length:1092 start_codon:yes stop_codon:yes gene_type:complete